MFFKDLVGNGSFETGEFSPWIQSGAAITSRFSHSGFLSLQLAGGTVDAYVFQFTPVKPAVSFEFLVSLSKIGVAPSPLVTITVLYYDADYNFLQLGLLAEIPPDHLPNVEDKIWMELYRTTDLTPDDVTQALVFISKLPEEGAADVVVDDVSLLEVSECTGPSGPSCHIGTVVPPESVSSKHTFRANLNENSVSVIENETNKVIAIFPVGKNPAGFGGNPLTGEPDQNF